MYKNPDSGLVNIGHILTVIERTGVRRGDRRLREMMSNLAEHHKHHGDFLHHVCCSTNFTLLPVQQKDVCKSAELAALCPKLYC